MTEEQKAAVVELMLLEGRPTTREQWDLLRMLPRDTLFRMGLGNWDGRLMLFPKEWSLHIPTGLLVEDINGDSGAFDRVSGVNGDTRYGFLAHGVPAVDGVVEEDV